MEDKSNSLIKVVQEYMEKLLSIIIPIYNVEKYIGQCLQSILISDTDLRERIEVIAVNDGTPDRSADMAKEFALRYPSVFAVLDKENGGHGSAFNEGLKHATGKYLKFIDSDDWFDTAALERLMKFLESSDVDMVLNPFNYFLVESKEYKLIPIKNMTYGKTLSMDEYDFVHSGNRPNLTVFHSATYRTSLLKKYAPFFAEKVFYDDVALRFVPIVLCNNFIAFDYPIYNYRVGRTGQTITYENKKKHAADINAVVACVIAFLSRCKSYQGKPRANYIRLLLSGMIYFQIETISRMHYVESKQILEEFRRVLLPAKGMYDKYRRHKVFDFLPFPLFFGLYRLYDLIFYKDKL